MCFPFFFYPLGTELLNSYIPGLYGTFCFHLKNHKSEINPAQPQSCYCYDGIYELIDLCHCQNYYRAIPVIVQSHLWPELPIFATDALLAICQGWYGAHVTPWWWLMWCTSSLCFPHNMSNPWVHWLRILIFLSIEHSILWTHRFDYGYSSKA